MESKEKIRRAIDEDTFYPDTAMLLRDKIANVNKINTAIVQSAMERFKNSGLKHGETYGWSDEGWRQYLADMRLMADCYVATRMQLDD